MYYMKNLSLSQYNLILYWWFLVKSANSKWMLNLLFLWHCHNNLVVMLLYYIHANFELKPVKLPVISLGNIIISFFFWNCDVKQWKSKLETKYEIKCHFSYHNFYLDFLFIHRFFWCCDSLMVFFFGNQPLKT